DKRSNKCKDIGFVNDRLLSVFVEIAQNEGINAVTLMERLGKTRNVIGKSISELVKNPLCVIERRGSNKTGGYFLTEKGKEMVEKMSLAKPM
ncbi:MAG: MarR family winged helix-turn-helix transcriptional regulator, partial [Bacteroides sp.]|nr:MarR family winged helix-turn-helix transcriptional regulator [Bacteroides sp.]